MKVIGTATILAVMAMGLAAPCHADDDPDSDRTFAMLLDNHGVLFNFRLERLEGQQYCESVIDGQSPLDATHDLMRDGDYSFDVANAITSAADVAYCLCASDTGNGISAPPSLCRPFELNYRRSGD